MGNQLPFSHSEKCDLLPDTPVGADFPEDSTGQRGSQQPPRQFLGLSWAHCGDCDTSRALMVWESSGRLGPSNRYFLPGIPSSRNFLSHLSKVRERKDSTPPNRLASSTQSFYWNALSPVAWREGSARPGGQSRDCWATSPATAQEPRAYSTPGPTPPQGQPYTRTDPTPGPTPHQGQPHTMTDPTAGPTPHQGQPGACFR